MSGDNIQIWMEGEVNDHHDYHHSENHHHENYHDHDDHDDHDAGVWSDPRASRVPCAHQRQHDRPLQGAKLVIITIMVVDVTFLNIILINIIIVIIIIRPPEDISTHMARLTEHQQRGLVVSFFPLQSYYFHFLLSLIFLF